MIENHSFNGNSCINNDTKVKFNLTTNKLSIEISQNETKETISTYIKNGIINFGLDLFFGSVQQNLEVIKRLEDATFKESQTLGYTIPISIYLKLSPRCQYTGRFKRNKTGVNLKLNRQVVLTSNRDYASRSCHSYIYVNAKFLIADVKRCDIICIGDSVQLLVLEVNSNDCLTCKVIIPGLVTTRTQVRFPMSIQMAHLRVSAEELEDLTFCLGVNIDVIVSCTPKNPEYCSELRETLAQLKCSHFHLFTQVTLPCLKTSEDALWIASAYDGFLIDCSNSKPADEIVKLSAGAREFIKKSHNENKPIFLKGCWSIFVDPSDYHCAFYYPDKYILPCESGFLRLFEAVFYKLSEKRFLHKNFPTSSLSTSESLARSIAGASFDFQADVIIVCSRIVEMAIGISHFKPRAVVLVVTSLMGVVNYLSMHHNIYVLLYSMTKKEQLSNAKETYKKLVYGMQFALLKNLVDSSSKVILVYRNDMQYGAVHKFAAIEFDKDYEKTIRKVISN